jgi:P4 family phage/plasmid primase-like protien
VSTNEDDSKPGPSQSAVFDVVLPDLKGTAIWRQERNEWWIKRENGVWEPEDVEQLQGRIHFEVLGMPDWQTGDGVTSGLLTGVKNMLRPHLAKPPTVFDKDPWVLGVQNGIVDLRTGELISATDAEEQYITRCCNASLDWDARNALWEQHMLDLFDGDKELMRCFQMHLGASLVGNAETDKPQVFLHMIGKSGGGKGTTTRVLARVLGSYAGHFRSKDLTAGQDRHTQWMTRLNGLRLAIFQEIRTEVMDVELLKTLSGGDPQVANEMRMADREWSPSHTLLFTSNTAINFDGDTDGMARRYVPLSTRSKAVDNPSGSYEKDLLADPDGIFMFALEGLDMWQDEHQGKMISLPQSVIDLRDSHLSGQAPYQQFVDEWIRFGDDNAQSHEHYRCFRKDVSQRFAWWLLNEKKDMVALDPHDKRLTKVYDVLDQSCRPGQPTIGDKQNRGWFGAHLVDEDEHWERTQKSTEWVG